MTASDHTIPLPAILFSAEHIDLSRGGKPVLRDISFTLSKGQATIVRGPNGVGKTTLLRAAAGFVDCDAGRMKAAASALYNGRGGVKPSLSVDENLKFWAALYGATSNDVEHAKSAFELHPVASHLAGELSTGYARRLGLARLPITKRPLWLVDEPVASLDDHASALFANSVAQHLQAGGSALIASHDPIAIADANILTLGTVRNESSP